MVMHLFLSIFFKILFQFNIRPPSWPSVHHVLPDTSSNNQQSFKGVEAFSNILDAKHKRRVGKVPIHSSHVTK